MFDCEPSLKAATNSIPDLFCEGGTSSVAVSITEGGAEVVLGGFELVVHARILLAFNYYQGKLSWR
jgi:hypothetical protein